MLISLLSRKTKHQPGHPIQTYHRVDFWLQPYNIKFFSPKSASLCFHLLNTAHLRALESLMPAFLEKESTVDFTLFSSDSALCFGSGREAKHISLSHQNGRREGWRMRRRRRRRRRRRTSIRWQVWSSPFFAGEGFHSAPTSRENQPLLFQRCWQSEPS